LKRAGSDEAGRIFSRSSLESTASWRGPAMKLPQARFTVRRAMIAVAVAGLLFAIEAWRRRAVYCLEEAAQCAEVEQSHLWMAVSHDRVANLYLRYVAEHKGSARYNREQAQIFRRASAGARATAKQAAGRGAAYRRVARYPWLALPAEGPMPAQFRRPVPTAPDK
jgi:hypothetical protein